MNPQDTANNTPVIHEHTSDARTVPQVDRAVEAEGQALPTQGHCASNPVDDFMADRDHPKVATRAKRKTTTPAEPSAVDKFARLLCDLKLEADALERFSQASVEWIKSVWLALAVAGRLAVVKREELPDSDKDLCLDDLLGICARHFEPELDGAYAEILVIAQEAGWRSPVEEVLRTAMAALQDFLSIACAPAVPIGRPSGGPTILDARASVLHALKELKRLRPLLVSGLRQRSQPTRRQLEIWRLLRGQALFDKEIAEQLTGHSSPGSVRNLISEMRDGGWSIEHESSIGYFRVDAPPPNLS